jgi:hypothetical protein
MEEMTCGSPSRLYVLHRGVLDRAGQERSENRNGINRQKEIHTHSKILCFKFLSLEIRGTLLSETTNYETPRVWLLCKEVCLNKLIRILRGFERLNAVGADIVEVAPAYNGVG